MPIELSTEFGTKTTFPLLQEFDEVSAAYREVFITDHNFNTYNPKSVPSETEHNILNNKTKAIEAAKQVDGVTPPLGLEKALDWVLTSSKSKLRVGLGCMTGIINLISIGGLK